MFIERKLAGIKQIGVDLVTQGGRVLALVRSTLSAPEIIVEDGLKLRPIVDVNGRLNRPFWALFAF